MAVDAYFPFLSAGLGFARVLERARELGMGIFPALLRFVLRCRAAGLGRKPGTMRRSSTRPMRNHNASYLEHGPNYSRVFWTPIQFTRTVSRHHVPPASPS